MFNDAISSTPSSVTFVDNQGEERSVQQLDGNFADHDDYLHFEGANGGFTVIMNSDICNTAVNPSSASLRVRSISNRPQSIARVHSVNSGKADDVKARLRGLFAKAKSVDPDRKLQIDRNAVESAFVSLKIYL